MRILSIIIFIFLVCFILLILLDYFFKGVKVCIYNKYVKLRGVNYAINKLLYKKNVLV
jgi:hypothetical protein